MRLEPLLEQWRDLPWQAQHDVVRIDGAGLARGLQNALQIGLGDEGNDRRHADRDRNASLRQRADGPQPPRRRGRARLQRAGDPGIERGDRDRGDREPPGRHRRQQIDVALDQRRLGDQRHRMVAFVQHLEHLTRDALGPLDRLIGVGVDAQRDQLAPVGRPRQRLAQPLGGIGLGVQLRLEIQARRQVEIGVRRPREAIDAAVLAAAIGVQRDAERDVRRRIAAQDRARLLLRDAGDQLRRRRFGGGAFAALAALAALAARDRLVLADVRRTPAIVEGLAGIPLEAPLQIADRTAALQRSKRRPKWRPRRRRFVRDVIRRPVRIVLTDVAPVARVVLHLMQAGSSRRPGWPASP